VGEERGAAGGARGGGRLALRLGGLQRRSAVLRRGGRESAPGRAVFARLQRLALHLRAGLRGALALRADGEAGPRRDPPRGARGVPGDALDRNTSAALRAAGPRLGAARGDRALPRCRRRVDRDARADRALVDRPPRGVGAVTERYMLREAFVLDESGGFGGPEDVLVDDGRIVAVGPLLAAGDAAQIDCSGLWLLPGIVDCHSHLAVSSLDPLERLRTPRTQWALPAAPNAPPILHRA